MTTERRRNNLLLVPILLGLTVVLSCAAGRTPQETLPVKPTSVASPVAVVTDVARQPITPSAPPPPPVSSEGNAALRQGLLALQQNRPDKAERAFARAVRTDPRSPLPHDYLGIAYFQQKRYDAALRQFHEEIRLDPVPAVGWARVGDIYHAQAKWKETIQALERAAALRPDLAQVQLNLGIVYPAVLELGKGVEALQRCVELDPQNAYAHYLLGNLLYRLTRLDEAERELNTALQLAPNNGTSHFGLAQVYLQRAATPENTERARTELEQALELGVGNSSEAHYYLGQCFQRQEKWEQARQELETSVKGNPRDWHACYALQDVLLRLGQKAEAHRMQARFRALRAQEEARMKRAFYTQEAQRNPDSPDARFQLAQFLARSGDSKQARQELARARQLAAGGKGTPGLTQRLAALSAELARGPEAK